MAEAKKHSANCKCAKCKQAAREDDAKTNKHLDDIESVHHKRQPGFTGGSNRPSKKTVKESTGVENFVRAITEKNYAEANKYLQSAVNDKIKSRIAQCAEVKPY